MKQKEYWYEQQINRKQMIELVNKYQRKRSVFVSYVEELEIKEGLDILFLQIGRNSVYLAVYGDDLQLTFSDHYEDDEGNESWENEFVIDFKLGKEIKNFTELKNEVKKYLNMYINNSEELFKL